MVRRAACSLLLVALLVLAGPGCEPPPPARVTNSREVMGTFAKVTAWARDRETAQQAVEAAYARLGDVNRLMSDYTPDSEIGKLNATAPGTGVVLAPETFHCLEAGARIAELTGGAFDFTCRPLVQLWKQAGRDNQLPSSTALETLRARVGWRRLRLDAATRTATPLVAGLQVDLGGIAKGYALDLAAEALRAGGALSGLVDVGGDIRVLGPQPDGGPWRVAVRHPFREGAHLCTLDLFDGAVATSGVQERFSTISGQRYSHIVDPRTGWPAAQAPSVTVVAPDGLTADAWATALSVLTSQEGRELLERQPQRGVEVLWIEGDAEHMIVRQTPNFELHVLEWHEPR